MLSQHLVVLPPPLWGRPWPRAVMQMLRACVVAFVAGHGPSSVRVRRHQSRRQQQKRLPARSHLSQSFSASSQSTATNEPTPRKTPNIK